MRYIPSASRKQPSPVKYKLLYFVASTASCNILFSFRIIISGAKISCNLRNLLLVSKTVVEAALVRENSRGAHYREDYPEEGDLETSYYTAVQMDGDQLRIDKKPVIFSMVKPGETILVEA
ncbi:MAG: hypothetical protein EBW34_04555 [Burkholderiaceae bacterium]|nr:hypothetical protein [Burkholderiaceae bacterium]